MLREEIESLNEFSGRDRRVRRIMAEYRSGNEALKQKAVADLLGELEGYIRLRVKKALKGSGNIGNKSFVVDYDDIVSECRCEVAAEMKNYSPEKGAPTTYFYFVITHAISSYNHHNINKCTQHYSQIANKVKTALSELQAKDIHNPSNSVIAVQAGLTVKQVEDALRIIRGSTEHSIYDAAKGDSIKELCVASAETEYMQKAEQSMWDTVMGGLDEKAKKAFYMYHGIESDPMTYTEISRLIDIPTHDVKNMVERTRRYLARNKDIRSFYKI